MGLVGLLYVGAVLFINGLLLLGVVETRAAAPMNLFVGGLQVVTPTYLIFTANNDPLVVLGALILTVIAAIKANEGVAYRYPFTLRLIG